ncbi:MAG: VOC family protein [Planctomyces sp.]|jgi:PhnB protein
MSKSVPPVPPGYQTITPYLLIRGASDAIAWYVRCFGAVEIFRLTDPENRVSHAEIRIGTSVLLLADEHPELGFLSPASRGGTTVSMVIYVDDADSVFHRAIENGATELQPLCDQFYGDRSGTVTDPWGHVWTVATHQEDLTPDEIRSRYQDML